MTLEDSIINGVYNVLRIAIVLAAAAISFVWLQIIYNIFFHPLRHYPGPLLWSATRLTHVLRMQSGHLHNDLLRLHMRYGPIVRIAPDELSYIDARALKDIYTSRAGQPVNQRNKVWFQKTRPDEPHSIMGDNEVAHARFRRAFNGAFTEKAIKEQAPLLERYVDLMMTRLGELARQSGGSAEVDMVEWLNFVTFDVSGEMSFGESFGSTDRGTSHLWVDVACNFGKGIALIASINHYAPFNKLLKYVLPEKVRKKATYHRQLSAMKVRKRLAQGEGRPDFVTAVLKYNDGKEEKVTPEELELNMSVFVFAGSETTSSALSATIFSLLETPSALKKLTEEVRSSFKKVEDVDINSVAKLDYLTAVIKEGLRIGPAAAIAVPRVSPEGGAEICGQHVPGGTLIALNQYPAFRSPANFTDPDKFVPERFLEGRSPYTDDQLDVFEPFLLGRHMCIGHRFAWAEMREVLARLLFTFDISWAQRPKFQDWGQQKTFIFWQKEKLMVRMTPR